MSRSLAAIFVVALCLLIGTPAQAAERPVTALPDGYGNGYNNVIGDKGAFQRIFRVGESKVAVYSLSFSRSVSMGRDIAYSATARRSTDINSVDRAADIAARSTRIGEPLPDPNAEAAAVQLAIWILTDGVDPAPTGTVNAPIRKRSEALVAAAVDLPGGRRELTIGMSARVSGEGEARRLTIKASNSSEPLVGVPVTVAVGNSTLEVRTNDDGVAIVKLAGASAGTEYQASFRWTLPAGTVLVPADGAPVVTSTDVQGVAKFRGRIPEETVAVPNRPTNTPRPKPIVSASASPTPSTTPTPTEPAPEESATPDGTDTLTDPAEMVIDFTDSEPTPEDPAEVRDSSTSLVAVGAALLLFVTAAFYAFRRSRD
jgi:hypothetical protein